MFKRVPPTRRHRNNAIRHLSFFLPTIHYTFLVIFARSSLIFSPPRETPAPSRFILCRIPRGPFSHRALPSSLSFILLFFPRFLPPLHAPHRTRRTKETVTPQLAKLLIYSLFNQINERVDAHFYAPVQLFMVYGNCPKRTRVHRSWPRPGP